MYAKILPEATRRCSFQRHQEICEEIYIKYFFIRIAEWIRIPGKEMMIPGLSYVVMKGDLV